MFRTILRVLVFSFISLYASEELIGGVSYDNGGLTSRALLVLGLSAVNFLILPSLRIVGFKTKGVGALVFRFIFSGLMLYFLMSSISGVHFVSTTLPELKISSFVLPSKGLNPFMSLVFTALLFSFFYGLLSWVGRRK